MLITTNVLQGDMPMHRIILSVILSIVMITGLQAADTGALTN